MKSNTGIKVYLNNRWALLVIGIIVNACLGTVYSWSVFREPLEQALGITASESGLPYSVFLAAFAFSMPVAGTLMDRLGTRLTLLIGGVLVGSGWISAGLITGFVPLVFAYGIVGGIGVGLAYGVPIAVAGSWFPDRRGFAMGLALAGFGVSPFVTAPLAEVLIVRFGVQTAMIQLGVLFIIVITTLSPFLQRRADHAHAAARGGGMPPRQMMGSKSFYGLWICYVIGTLAGLTAIGMTAPFGRQVAGLSVPAATAAVAAFGVLNGLGRPLFGSIHDTLGSRRSVILSFGLIAVGAGVSLFAQPGVVLPFFIGFGILWLMLGGWLAIAPAATTHLFGVSHYARNYGIMYTAYGVGALAGGSASGALYSSFETYKSMPVFILVLCGVGVVVALLMLEPARLSVRREHAHARG
ncbi:MAG: OFA family MFS transporter [Spirochaetota bacterium]